MSSPFVVHYATLDSPTLTDAGKIPGPPFFCPACGTIFRLPDEGLTIDCANCSYRCTMDGEHKIGAAKLALVRLRIYLVVCHDSCRSGAFVHRNTRTK